MKRHAVVYGDERLDTVKRYMPSNYRAYHGTDGKIYIVGEDFAGWTLEGYVIPRLSSGLIAAKEITDPNN